MFDTNIKSKIRMNGIMNPISKELDEVNSELKNILSEFDLVSDDGILKQVQKNPDRLIRQAMILLPVKAIGKSNSEKELLRLCAAAEIVYGAVNLHNKIIDPDKTRGKIPGEKGKINNSHAVLNGDTLLTLALLVASEIFPKNLLLDITRLVEKSCYMKISEEIQGSVFKSNESHIDSLEDGTAEITSTIALLAAYASKANVDEAALLKKCGYNLGMLYRIAAGNKSGKIACEEADPSANARHYAEEAEKAISGFKESAYKRSLLKLVRLFYSDIRFDFLGRCKSEAK